MKAVGYLIDRDVGISPRHGLNAGMDPTNIRFRQLAHEDALKWENSPSRIDASIILSNKNIGQGILNKHC